MSPLAKTLVLVAAVVALLGIVVIGVVTVTALFGDPLNFLAVPILVGGIVLVIATLLVFAVIFQGLRNLREDLDDVP